MSRERCSWADDGRHRYRFAVSRMAGTPYYGCGPSCAIVLPTGDGFDEDVAYLAPDLMVVSCAACDVEGEVGTTIVVTDDDTALCRQCADDPATVLTLVERYGERCAGCVDHLDVLPWVLPHVDEAHLCPTCEPNVTATLVRVRGEVTA